MWMLTRLMSLAAAIGILLPGSPVTAQEPMTPEAASETPEATPSEAASETPEATPPEVPSPEPMPPQPTTSRVECKLLYETVDGMYIDLGGDAGLLPGDIGWIEHGGQQVRFEVLNVASDSSFLKLEGERDASRPKPGDRVTLSLDRVLIPVGQDGPRQRSPTLKGDDENSLQPLLAPYNLGDLADAEPRNIFQGRLTFRQFGQTSTDGDLDFLRTRLGSSGSLERIDGTPWALEWSWDLSYRDGDALEFNPDYQETRLEVYQASLFRRYDDTSFQRLGRFIPIALPSVGYIDGWQGEMVVDDRVRVGGVAGFRASRDDLDFTDKEPTLAPYVSFFVGDREDVHYSSTLGLLFSMYDGKADRLAFLWDQRLTAGRFSLIASSEVDFDVGGAEFTDSFVELNRVNTTASYDITDSTTLRVGIDRFAIPDIEAERDIVGASIIQEELFFDDDYWRYWGGASHELGEHWYLSEEVSFNEDDIEDGIHWLATLTRRGLPFSPAGSASLSVYSLNGDDLDGFGGRLSAYIPWGDRSFSLSPSVAFRVAEFDPDSEDFEFLDVSLRAHWWPSPKWSVSGGVAYGSGDDEQRILGDIGVTLRW